MYRKESFDDLLNKVVYYFIWFFLGSLSPNVCPQSTSRRGLTTGFLQGLLVVYSDPVHRSGLLLDTLNPPWPPRSFLPRSSFFYLDDNLIDSPTSTLSKTTLRKMCRQPNNTLVNVNQVTLDSFTFLHSLTVEVLFNFLYVLFYIRVVKRTK